MEITESYAANLTCLMATLFTFLVSCPVIFISSDLLRSTWLASHWQWSLPPPDLTQISSMQRYISVPQWNRCLNVTGGQYGGLVYTKCYPCGCLHESHNQVLGIKVFITFSVDKKNQLDVAFCILYFSSNSCSTCFGQPRAHHQELTTA